MAGSVTALLLAGRRPGVDPLAAHFGVADKALIEIGGEPMLSRVARTLLGHPLICRIIILAQDGAALTGHAGTRWMASDDRIGFEQTGNSIAGSLVSVMQGPADYPYLVTTADNPLLDHDMIDAFLTQAKESDVAFALVERRTLLAAYPDSRRTWLRFRGGAYSGANLFWLGNARVLPVLGLWQRIEQRRKKARAVIGAFGFVTLIGAGLRILSLDQGVRRAGRRFGLTARAVILPFAEACIDVDKAEDHELVETILARRQALL